MRKISGALPTTPGFREPETKLYKDSQDTFTGKKSMFKKSTKKITRLPLLGPPKHNLADFHIHDDYETSVTV